MRRRSKKEVKHGRLVMSCLGKKEVKSLRALGCVGQKQA